MDQTEYLMALKQARSPLMVGLKGDAPLPPELAATYWSLLGALAYASITQYQLAVYVVALQRATAAPEAIHLRRLNALVKVAQASPATIVFKSMKDLGILDVHSDSSFSREQDKGYGMRGATFMRKGLARDGSGGCYHLLDVHCRSHKLVVRSTFAAETLAATSAADAALVIGMNLQELREGPLTARAARRLREEGHFDVEINLLVDAMSLFAAVAATNPRVPAERSLLGHIFWLHELVLSHSIQLKWTDTRDMVADALTKGSIDRNALLQAMAGSYECVHPCKVYSKRPA